MVKLFSLPFNTLIIIITFNIISFSVIVLKYNFLLLTLPLPLLLLIKALINNFYRGILIKRVKGKIY